MKRGLTIRGTSKYQKRFTYLSISFVKLAISSRKISFFSIQSITSEIEALSLLK